MKKIRLAFAGMAALWAFSGSVAYAEDDEAQRDHIKIEKTTASGATVTVVEGTDTVAGEDYVESTRVTTNTVRTPIKTVTKVVEVPVAVSEPHKARLAVLPAIFSKHFQPVFKFSEKIEISGQTNLKMIFTTEHESRLEAPSFTLSLSEAFVNSRKFDVLERARLTETLKEIDFGESDYADASKAVPMGKALNAEYVVLPEIEVIHLVEEIKETPYVGTIRPILKGKMIVRNRVVDTGGTKVVAASTEEVQVERKLKENNPFLQSEINNLIIDLYQTASLRMLHRTIEAIYPVRLLEVVDGKVVLNRGEGAIAAGDEFEVYSLGKAYVDPDTGEMLGQGETKAAVIRVVRVAPKFAEAEIVEGAEALVGDVKGFLCRETASSIQAKTTASRNAMNW
jgi:hypothetical protein